MKQVSIFSIARLPDHEVEALLIQARWPDGPTCPKCSSRIVRRVGARKVFRCSDCRREFTVTSGTILSARKMPLQAYLAIAFMFAASGNGISSLVLSRMLGIMQKTAFVLGHKFRAALQHEQSTLTLSGQVEIDGCFVGGHREHSNMVKDGRTYRVTRGRFKNRRVVTVARERGGRSVTYIGKKESDALAFLNERLAPDAVVHADLAHAWDSLIELHHMLRINHKVAFSMDGACTNNAESYFAGLRRMAMGVHHRVSGPYLGLYTAEMAWRIDRAGWGIEEKLRDLLAMILNAPAKEFVGYWQVSPELKEAEPQTSVNWPPRSVAWQGDGELIAAVPEHDIERSDLLKTIDRLSPEKSKFLLAIIDGASLEEAAQEAGMSVRQATAEIPAFRDLLTPYLKPNLRIVA